MSEASQPDHILIVDNDPNSVEHLKEIFRSLGSSALWSTDRSLHVDVTDQFDDAVNRIHQDSESPGRLYLFVLINIRTVNDWNGPDFASRTHRDYPEIPLILYSSETADSPSRLIADFEDCDGLFVLRTPLECADVIQLARTIQTIGVMNRHLSSALDEIGRLTGEDSNSPKHEILGCENEIERFKCLAEIVGQGMLIVSFDNCIEFANTTLARMLDYEDESEICGKHIGELFDPQTYEYAYHKIHNELLKKGKWMAEFPMIDRLGNPVHAIHDIFLIHDQMGRPRCYGSIITDVTSQKQTVVDLRNYAKRMEEENKRFEDCRKQVFAERKAKSAFMTNLSHELRNSLHAISSFAQFGHRKIDKLSRNELDRYFELIRENGDSLLKSLDALLELERYETQMGKLALKKTDLYELIRIVVDEFKYGGALQNRTVRFERPQFDNNAAVDRHGIMRVVRNLIENAVRYSPDGSEIAIEIYKPQDDKIAVRVADRGCGIAPSELDVIFNKFYRSSAKTNEDDCRYSAGLGLAICKEIVLMHGGTIEGHNQKDGGAVFQFEIPKDLTEMDGEMLAPPTVIHH